jgi:hypothetical protein
MATDSLRLLGALLDADVEFIVIDGVAALTYGALTPTQDLDVAVRMTEDNLEKLLRALRPLRPYHALRRDLGPVSQSPGELMRFRVILLETDAGRLDVLGALEPIGPFDQLAWNEFELIEGRSVRVLDLDQLIEIKAHLRRPKDKLVELELRAIRDRMR